MTDQSAPRPEDDGAQPIRPSWVKWGIALIGVIAIFGLVSAIWARHDAETRIEALQAELQSTSAAQLQAEQRVSELEGLIAKEGNLEQRTAALEQQVTEREQALATVEQQRQDADTALNEAVTQK